MEDTLEQVRQHCALHLERFTFCVSKHEATGDWDTACVEEKKAVTKCAEENVGVIARVKRECDAVITAYDDCLAENSTTPEKCIAALRGLYECTNRVSDEYHADQLAAKLP